MKDILEDIETRMFALDRALPDNSAARDLLEILHRSQVEIGKLREGLRALVRAVEADGECQGYDPRSVGAAHTWVAVAMTEADALLSVIAPAPEAKD